MKGWKYEGYRHSLAAKGICSKLQIHKSSIYGIKTSFRAKSRLNFEYRESDARTKRITEIERLISNPAISNDELHRLVIEYEQLRKEADADIDKTSFLFKKDETKGMLDVFKSNSERYDHGHEISRTFSNKVKQSLLREMDKFEQQGKISLDSNRRFMEDQYASLEKKFQDRSLDADQFKDEVDRSYKLFYQHNKKVNSAFGWADGEAEQEPSLCGEGEKKGQSIWGF